MNKPGKTLHVICCDCFDNFDEGSKKELQKKGWQHTKHGWKCPNCYKLGK